MKSTILAMTFALLVSAGTMLTAQKTETWTGKISDSSCGASHDMMTEHGTTGTDKDCTLMCVKKGAKYVFVSGNQVRAIANQDFKDLQQFAGDTVTLTGELKDNAITVRRIEKAQSGYDPSEPFHCGHHLGGSDANLATLIRYSGVKSITFDADLSDR